MSKLRGKQADKMANGVTLLLFGFLFLLIQLRISDHWIWLTYIKNPATYFLIAGVVFLWLRSEKALGYILTGIGIIGYSDIALGWSRNYTQFAFPLLVMLSGIGLIFFSKK